jgi:hypothetical protein
MNTGEGVRTPGLRPPTQGKMPEEKISDFRIMPQAEYDA